MLARMPEPVAGLLPGAEREAAGHNPPGQRPRFERRYSTYTTRATTAMKRSLLMGTCDHCLGASYPR
jgi:hypothetical protein